MPQFAWRVPAEVINFGDLLKFYELLLAVQIRLLLMFHRCGRLERKNE